MIFDLYLDFPPTVNSYYSHTKRGVFISKKGRLYREAVNKCVKEQLAAFDQIDYPIMCEIILFPPDRRKRDVDNYNKSLLDAITLAGVWVDDSLIDQLFIYRGEVVKKGLVMLRVSKALPILALDSGLNSL